MSNLKVISTSEDLVEVQPPNCPFCGKVHEPFLLEKSLFEKWTSGAMIQDCFPSMLPDKREILISGTCPTCWDEAMGEDDEVST